MPQRPSSQRPSEVPTQFRALRLPLLEVVQAHADLASLLVGLFWAFFFWGGEGWFRKRLEFHHSVVRARPTFQGTSRSRGRYAWDYGWKRSLQNRRHGAVAGSPFGLWPEQDCGENVIIVENLRSALSHSAAEILCLPELQTALYGPYLTVEPASRCHSATVGGKP